MSVETANFPVGLNTRFIGRLPTLVSVPSGGSVIFLPVTSWSVIWAPTRAAHGMAGNTRLTHVIQKRTSLRVFSGRMVMIWRPFYRLLVIVLAGFSGDWIIKEHLGRHTPPLTMHPGLEILVNRLVRR